MYLTAFCFVYRCQLIHQLKPGGRLIVPVGPEGCSQMLTLVDKHQDGSVTETQLLGVIYGSLTTKEKQLAK